MTQVVVVLVGLVAGFAGSRLLRTTRSSSNVRDRGGPRGGQQSSQDRLRQIEADRAAQQRPAALRAPVTNAPPPVATPVPPAPEPATPDPTWVTGTADPYLVRDGAPAGETQPLTGAAVTIGRGSDRDIRVDEPQASREHGTFRPRRSGPGWTYTDLGSSNGTRINGRPVTANQRIELRDGDTVEIGPARFTFHAAAGPPVRQAPPVEDPDRTQQLDLDEDGRPR